jgi:hypothetical protein
VSILQRRKSDRVLQLASRTKSAAKSAVKVHSAAIEMVPLGDLKPYEKNARLHPEDQLAALEAIVRDSGFTAPLIIDPENSIIAGHGRALVAKRLGMAAVPCVRVTGLSAAQVKALRLSDNQAALRGSWDKDLLLGELTGLGAEGFDLGLTAFTPFELGEIKVPGFLPEEQLAEAEETPDPPANPCVGLGQVWLLGEHRLIIGDSTDAGTVERLLAGAKPNLMVTDPPYGVSYDPAWRGSAKRAGTGKRLSLGVHAKGKVQNDDNADWSKAWALFPGDTAYVWHAGNMAHIVAQSLIGCGLDLRAQTHLEQEQHCHRARRLSPKARAVLVRCAQGQAWQLHRRSQAMHGLGYSQAPKVRNRPRHPEADRVHAPADPQQLQAGRRCL